MAWARGHRPLAVQGEHLREALAEALRLTGAVVVGGVSTHSDSELLALARTVGVPSAVGNGDGVIHEVRPEPEAERRDISSTDAAFPPHTDSTALDRPHDIVCLACVSAPAGAGGESVVVALDDLRAALPGETLDALSEPAFPFPLNDPQHGQGVRMRPVLDNGHIRYRRDVLEIGQRASGRSISATGRQALDELDQALEDPSRQRVSALRPGDVLFVDNRRALHGRTAISPGAERHMRRLKVYAGV